MAVHRRLSGCYPHGTSAAVVLRGPGLLDERAEDLPHLVQEDSSSITVQNATVAGLESINGKERQRSRDTPRVPAAQPHSDLGCVPAFAL